MKILKYLAIRIGILILTLAVVGGLMFWAYDPHSNCIGNEHRHTMGIGMGLFVAGIFISIIWLLACLVEGFIYFSKTNNKIGSAILFLIIFLVLLATLIT